MTRTLHLLREQTQKSLSAVLTGDLATRAPESKKRASIPALLKISVITCRCTIIALAVADLLALTGCGKIVVTGRVHARPDSGGGAQDIVSLSVTRGNLEAATAARLVTFQPGGVDRVWRDLTAQLRSDITNNPSQ